MEVTLRPTVLNWFAVLLKDLANVRMFLPAVLRVQFHKTLSTIAKRRTRYAIEGSLDFGNSGKVSKSPKLFVMVPNMEGGLMRYKIVESYVS